SRILPEISVKRRPHAKLNVHIIWIVRSHRVDLDDLTDVATHQAHRLTDLEPRSRLYECEVVNFLQKPPFAFGNIINVIPEAKQQERRCDRHEPAHYPLEPAQAGAQLRSEIVQCHRSGAS